GLLQLRSGRQHDVRIVGRIGKKQLMYDREEIFATKSLHNESGIGTGCCWIGSKNVERFDRGMGDFSQQGRSEPVHVNGTTRRRRILRMMHALTVPLQVPARAVRQPAAAGPVLPRQRRQGADGSDILAAVVVPVDAVGNLYQARSSTSVQA